MQPLAESSSMQGDAWFVAGGGETGALVRSIDWRTTPLGPAAEWRQSLRTAAQHLSEFALPIALYWGPEFLMLYNDSLLPMVGSNKHPHAMGQPALVVLAEIRGIIEPLLRHVSTTGEATWSEDLMLPLVRGAAPEESYFTFTYSPIRDESGGVGGVFCAVVETTEKVIEERRLRLLNALAEANQARTKEDACAHAALHMARFRDDVPFAAPLPARRGRRHSAPRRRLQSRARHEARTRVDSARRGARRLATRSAVDRGRATLPRAQRRAERQPRRPDPNARALPGGGRPLGYLILGLSPLLSRSVSYDRFHHLLASSLAQAVSHAAAYEDARQRAEALAELDRAKTTFFSNVSHEFRTPLTLMLAPIQDLLTLPEGAPLDARPSSSSIATRFGS